MSQEKITILIADDHKLIRETWAFILNSDDRFKVVAECASGEEAIELAKTIRPCIILMDINMAPISGIEATIQVRKLAPATKIIAVSMHSQPAYAKKMLSVGARGYVTKNSSREEMIKAILEVYNGNKYVCEEVKNIISEQMLDDHQEPSINLLSEREIQIVRQIKEGASSKEISSDLNISLKTVEVHRHNILRKLNLKNTAALVNFINNSAIDLV